MSRDSLAILACSNMSIPMYCSSHRDIPNIHLGSHRGMNPPVSMLSHLQTLYRIVSSYTNLRHMDWGVISIYPCHLTLSLKDPFKRKTLEMLVSQHLQMSPPKTIMRHFLCGKSDMILVNRHKVSWSIHWVFNWHQIWRVFIFHMDKLNFKVVWHDSHRNPNFQG